MGFRYYKRIKLGKGFGLNVSKSGIRPSYRSKRGSVNSKGFSIRTGIPGLTYRSSFGKSKGSGCMVLIVFALSIAMTTSFIGCDTSENGDEVEVIDNQVNSNCGTYNGNKL